MSARAPELVCLETRPHGVILARPLAQAVALALLGAVLLAQPWPALLLGALAQVAAAALAVHAVWRWERTRIVVTTQKLVVRAGTLRRREAAVWFARAGTVTVEQGVVGRLLGYGTLLAGELEVPFLPRPRQVHGLMDRLTA